MYMYDHRTWFDHMVEFVAKVVTSEVTFTVLGLVTVVGPAVIK